MPDHIGAIVVLGLWLLYTIVILIKVLKNKFAPVQCVKATVIDKHTIETFSKYSGTGKSEKYVVVFSVDGKKKSFYVSQFSYGGYRLNEKGTLKYKGNKLIGFQ